MNTQRTTVSTLFTLAVSAFVCLLAVEAMPQQSAQTGNAQGSAQTASQEGEASDVGIHVAVDRKPLEDFFEDAAKLLKGDGLDLNKPVSLRIEANLANDGTLKNFTVVQDTGDPRILDVARNFVSALGASHALSALGGAERFSGTLALTNSALSSSLLFEASSSERAASLVRGYNTLFHFAALAKRGRDEALILDSIKASANEENVTLTFSMPRETLNALLSRTLANY